MTVDRLWRALTHIEQREDLLNWRIGNVYLWPLVRMRLYREIAESAGIFERLPERPEIPQVPLKHVQGRSEFAVVPFLRRNLAGEDLFSQPIVDALAGTAAPLIFGMGEHDIDSGRLQVEQLEREFLRRYRTLAKLRVLPSLRRHHELKWQRVIAYFESEFGIALKSNRVFPRWLLVNFVAQRHGWFRLFASLGVRKVFVVNAWKRAMIAGAQKAGAIVVEPQHGLLSDMHPLIEAGLPGRNVVQIGIADFSNSPEYAARARELGIHVIPRSALRRENPTEIWRQALLKLEHVQGVHVDFDVDVCDRAAVPACPAAAPGGLSADQLREFAELAGRTPVVKSMDITEIDATADSADQRTIRLGALLILEAAAGLANRGK